jgi:hypothetical protein
LIIKNKLIKCRFGYGVPVLNKFILMFAFNFPGSSEYVKIESPGGNPALFQNPISYEKPSVKINAAYFWINDGGQVIN